MLYTNSLENKIFNVHRYINCDELIIISGYVGPNPIKRLASLPIRTTVIYGMYGTDSISDKFHTTLLSLHNSPKNIILYSNIPIHSKIYIWKYQGEITYALIGSANFSTNGLNIPHREALAETTNDTFSDLNIYLYHILDNSVTCDTITITPPTVFPSPLPLTLRRPIACDMILYDPRTNQVPTNSGLNWGQSINGHTNLGDAYIPIRTSHIRNFPTLFPPKQMHSISAFGGRPNRQNDSIELIWDDGILMEALLEGSQTIDGKVYPKQLSSFPSKNTLGNYLRNRIGILPTDLVTKPDLINYGRDHLRISLLQEGTYYVDFSI